MADGVETTVQYAKHCDDLAAAWAFIFEYIDKVGPNPTVTIEPFWSANVDDEGQVTQHGRKFEVCLSGELDDAPEASEGASDG